MAASKQRQREHFRTSITPKYHQLKAQLQSILENTPTQPILSTTSRYSIIFSLTISRYQSSNYSQLHYRRSECSIDTILPPPQQQQQQLQQYNHDSYYSQLNNSSSQCYDLIPIAQSPSPQCLPSPQELLYNNTITDTPIPLFDEYNEWSVTDVFPHDPSFNFQTSECPHNFTQSPLMELPSCPTSNQMVHDQWPATTPLLPIEQVLVQYESASPLPLSPLLPIPPVPAWESNFTETDDFMDALIL